MLEPRAREGTAGYDSSMPSFYVGVDGGGTRTRAVVTASDLLALGRGASGPANASTVPVPRLVQSVTEAVDDALEAAGASRSDLAVVSCGLAGVEASAMKGRLVAALEAVYGAGRVRVTTDARIALAGALADPVADSGAVLIAGTGAICFGRNSHGLEERAGGWGALIGDEGSASEIARRGLAAVARDVDGRGPRTKMREALHSSEGTRSAVEMVQKLFRPGAGPTDTRPTSRSSSTRRATATRSALEILRWAGGELALDGAHRPPQARHRGRPGDRGHGRRRLRRGRARPRAAPRAAPRRRAAGAPRSARPHPRDRRHPPRPRRGSAR